MLLYQIEARLKDYAAKLKQQPVDKSPLAKEDVVMLGVPLPRDLHKKMSTIAKENNVSLKKLAVYVLSAAFKD